MNTVVARRTAQLLPALADILRPDVNVVSVPRRLEPSLEVKLRKLAQCSSFSHSATLEATSPDVGPLLASIGEGPVRDFLAEEIRVLAGQLGAILERQHLGARLYVTRSDGCRKIHSDNVTIRLLCTYAGPGTEWLSEDDLVRSSLRPSQRDAESHNRAVIRKGGTLRRCAPGEILLLKGQTFPGNAGRGAAHRSPPLGSSGVARLVLKIDEGRCGC